MMDTLELEVMLDDLFYDKELKTEKEVWKFCELLKDLVEASAQDYIDDELGEQND